MVPIVVNSCQKGLIDEKVGKNAETGEHAKE